MLFADARSCLMMQSRCSSFLLRWWHSGYHRQSVLAFLNKQNLYLQRTTQMTAMRLQQTQKYPARRRNIEIVWQDSGKAWSWKSWIQKSLGTWNRTPLLEPQEHRHLLSAEAKP
jgi:hypothetical protein